MSSRRNSLTWRLIELILVVSVVILTLGILTRSVVQKDKMDRDWASFRERSVARIQASCVDAVWQLDVNLQRAILRSELLNQAVVAVRVHSGSDSEDLWVTRAPEGSALDPQSFTLAASDREDFDLVWMPNTPNSRPLARVTVWFDESELVAEFWGDIVWNMVLVTTIIVALTFSLLWVVVRRLIRPLESIRAGMKVSAVASSLGTASFSIRERLASKTFPELVAMAEDLDRVFLQVGEGITKRLESEEKVRAVNLNLDFLVRERTAELAQANESLNQALETVKKAQEELVSSAQLTVLGRLVASIAHEINTPVGAIISANSTVLDGLSELTVSGWKRLGELGADDVVWLERLLVQGADADLPSGAEERQLRRTYGEILARLGAPDIEAFAQLLVDVGGPWDEETLRSLLSAPQPLRLLEFAQRLRILIHSSRIINAASDRVAKFVLALRTYVRKEDEVTPTEVDLEKSLDSVLLLFQHQFKLGVEVVKDFEPVPRVRCRPDEIQQVWANLISNANHAMEYHGTLTLGLRALVDGVCVSFTDTGHGILPEDQARIFEPFFTTKTAGDGTGLGLDISRKIVEASGGTMTVESQPGHTVFRVTLPRFTS